MTSTIPSPSPTQQSTENATSTIELVGYGSMISVYKLDSEDDFNELLESAEDDDLDWGDFEDEYEDNLDECWTLQSEPTILVNGNELDGEKSLAELGVEISKETEQLVKKGSYYAVISEGFKGLWGQLEGVPTNEATDLSNYKVVEKELHIGSGPTSLHETLTEVTFMDGKYGQFNSHELDGKSNDYYLIDANGTVHSV